MNEFIEKSVQKIWENLGSGYSERMYHNALEVCLRRANIPYETERIMPVVFDGHTLGNLRADLVVDGRYVIELKSTKTLRDEHRTQVRLYLKLLGLRDGI